MEEKTNQKKILRTLLNAFVIIPLLFGMYGFMVMEGESFADSLYRIILMFSMNYGEAPPNFCVEIARWTALAADAAIVVSAISFAREKACNFFKYCFGDSIAVYGPENEKKELLKQFKWHQRVDGGNKFVMAHRYVLLNNEASNFDFYNEHRKKLCSKKVYIRADSLWTRFINKDNVKIFSPEESAARLFWKSKELWDDAEKSPYRLADRHGHELDIVLIGFGRLGAELIYWGMQNNIFFPDQRIRYHVFGDCTGFISTHTELEHISDKIFQHSEPWTDWVGFIEKADIVLVPEQKEQDALLKDLLFTTTRKNIYVFAPKDSLFAELKKTDGFDDRFIIFPWQEESYKWENIEKDLLFKSAMAVNDRYNSQVREAGNAELAKEWEELDAFTKYSNVSTADYDEIRRRIFKCRNMPIPETKDKISEPLCEEMSELEHIRWCRYHYLNNWKTMDRIEGCSSKDKERRLHADLVDYKDLSDKSRDKDKEITRDIIARLKFTDTIF